MEGNLPLSKAIFLDRDGTIIEEVPSSDPDNPESLGYVLETSQVKLIEGSANAIALARSLGYKVIIISNQSAIARGWITEKQLDEINDEMYGQLMNASEDAIIDDLFFSPFHVDGKIEKYRKDSPTRKPGIGMILEAKKKYNIDLTKSYLIGDSFTDMKCAENAGIRRILVLTGYGQSAYEKCLDEGLKINFIANNLLEAISFVERQ